MGEAINLVNSFKVEKVIFNNEAGKEYGKNIIKNMI